MALSTAVCSAVMIKSAYLRTCVPAYLSKSLVDKCQEKSSEPSASSSTDPNTSQSVWSNLYLVWLVKVLLTDVVSIVGDFKLLGDSLS